MKAELIAVGTELLTGQVLNTNAQYLATVCADLGFDVYFQTVVGDNRERLLSVLELASGRSDLVILCGGLGPTDDDLTKETLADFLGRELVLNQPAYDKMVAYFKSRGRTSFSPNNRKQVMSIKDGKALENPAGLALGDMVTVADVTYILLPGPPSELKAMVEQSLLPLLAPQKKLYSRVLRFFGIGESQLVTDLAELITKQTDPTIAPYAKPGEVTLRLSTKAASLEQANRKLTHLEEQILSCGELASFFYGYGDDNSLAQVVVALLKQQGLTVTAAESLTAGLFQASLADISGSSAVFKGGFVTYGLAEKASLLSIPREDLEREGVVSAYAAAQMAEKSRQKLDADFGIGLTGVAGPDRLENHPVGTVYLGLASRTEVKTYALKLGDRSRSYVRKLAVLSALDYLRRALLNDGHLV